MMTTLSGLKSDARSRLHTMQSVAKILIRNLKAAARRTTSIVEITKENLHDKSAL
jgi:hypothetical protein